MRPLLLITVIFLISAQTVLAGGVSATALASDKAVENQSPNNQIINNNTIDLTDPVRMLKQTTDQVLQLARTAKATAAQDREAYYRDVEAIVRQVVDQTYFARGVMGSYASARRYQSLTTNQEREAFNQRIDRFTEALRRSFILTYADALLSFDGERFELEPPPALAADSKDIFIKQKIISATDVYQVHYRLRKNNHGDWLITNVIVEGLNMGSVYRNQFADAVESHNNDVDYVVQNWHRIMTRVTPRKDPEQQPRP